MTQARRPCPDCESDALGGIVEPHAEAVTRRQFIQTTGVVAATAALGVGGLRNFAQARDSGPATPESLVKTLYDSLTDVQRKEVCFAWDHQHPQWGLLRTRVANNWHITKPIINTDFYTDDQRDIVRGIFEGIIQPDWHSRIDQQLEDDAGGFGQEQNFAIFGTPGEGKYEFVMTGRHMTLRCDGNSADHVAFGGPIFYGHAATGFDEEAHHPGNVYWHQAVEANKLYEMLDGKQRELALVAKRPREQNSGFQGASAKLPGIPAEELSSDQREHLQKVLQVLIEPYRQSDRDEVVACLKAQGGLDKCSLAFYREGNIGNDEVWDCWRLEGPSFVWYFRGSPHVHVWVNVADTPSVELNA